MKILSERLKQLRLERDLIQDDIAKTLSSTRSTVGNWETGRADPDLETLVKIAELFDVSLDYLLGKSDVRKVNYVIDDFLIDLPEKSRQSAKDYIDYLKHRK